MKQLNNMITFQDIADALILFGSNDEGVVKAVQNKRRYASMGYEVRYQSQKIIETNQTHLLRDLVYDYMNRFKASRKTLRSFLIK